MATAMDVRRMCLALPGVSERSSWGQPAWFAKTLMARIWEEGVLTVKTDEREALRARNRTPTSGRRTTTVHRSLC
ncbi:MmcQ/YjbR family DNA-binding protein [Pseudarthrobacter sp. CCNWLW207]|uniref:MmcQ/YjbR family DNA-binding protein n=1 Tax=Pseudarthrobacter sp. CCNWLW207 TaxID=3127468 RepID=UPI0030787447